MSEQPCIDIKNCPHCETEQLEQPMIADVQTEYQGKIPLVVFYYRCPLCWHEWSEAQ